MDRSRKIRQPFAAAVRRHRRDAGLTQEELAERAGLAVPTIRNTESGRHTPQRHTFLALAGAFGLSPEGTPAAYAGFEAAWRAQRGAGSGRDEAPTAPDERAPSPGGPPTTGREAPRRPAWPAGLVARRAGPPGTPGSPPRRPAWAAALVAAVAVLLVALLGRIHTGSPRATGGGATPPVAPGAARAALKPGGRWIIPSAEGYVIRGDTFRLSAHAYPTNQGDPPIAHVNFTANWLGPAGGWRVLCQVTAPRAGTDEYDCTLDLARDRVPNGPINLSFDVFDVEGNVNEAPNGTKHGRVER